MTIEKIKEMMAGSDYDFLRTNPHLKDRIIFLTLGGSHAYGTNVDTSDVDIRGCAFNSASDILGLSNFEQVVHSQTDTTVYSFRKLVLLLISCNPNTIEMLGCKPEHYLVLTDVGKQMIENRSLFLSQHASASFGGYATQQLRRLQNALARDRVPQVEKEEYICSSMQRTMKAFAEQYHMDLSMDLLPEIEEQQEKFGSIHLFTDESQRQDLDREIFCNIAMEHFPAREFTILLNTLSSIIGSYTKLDHRNRKKDEAHLDKHAMHLIRLYLMALDILEKGEINTYREQDRDFLLSIRKGVFRNSDGTYRPEFFELVDTYENRLAYAKKNTALPRHPDMKRIEEFVMDVNRRALSE